MALKDAFFSEKKRYFTAIALLILLFVVVWIDSVFLTWLVLGIFFLLGFNEALGLFECQKSYKKLVFPAILWIFSFFVQNPIELGIFFLMLLSGFLAYKKSFKPQYIYVFIYPTIPFLALLSLYKNFGLRSVIFLIIVIAICDTMAYFGGKVLGKTPLSPTSPKKTIEGVIVGVATAICIGSLLGIGMLSLHFLKAIFVSFVVALSGVLGDLFESFLKRRIDIKDSGSILPGHGGVLDRFDAILFGAIALAFLLQFFSKEDPSAFLIF